MKRLGAEERRRQLLGEAIVQFGARGYEGATLDAIARSCGVRKQTLLYYFPNKEALFEACISDLAGAVEEALERGLAGPEEGWDRIEAVIDAIFGLAEKRPELMPLVREAARQSPETIQHIAQTLEPLRKRALAFLERGMEAGLFRTQDPGLLLFMLYTAVVGSITEAGVLSALAGQSRRRVALRRRKHELIGFVRRSLQP
jgi:TetR/AcrR family transcriptional regulator